MKNKFKEKKSTKSKLIRVISKKFLVNYLFSSNDNLEEKFQEELDKYLKFETSVCRVDSMKNERGATYIDVYFEDDANVKKGIAFTIIPNSDEYKVQNL